MKKCYQLLSMVLIALLVAMIPVVTVAQDAAKPDTAKKTETAKVKSVAPSYNYWSIQAFGGLMQFNGDLSQNLLWNFKSSKDGAYGYTGSGYNYGLAFTKQFTRVIGARLRFAHGQLQSEVSGKYIYDTLVGGNTLTNEWFRAFPWETDLQVTINWLNWILGYKPERVFSSYLIAGIGVDQTIGHKVNTNTGASTAWIGQSDQANNVGNTGGIAGHDLQWKYSAGLGFDFNIHKHWSIPIEILWRLRGDDKLDMTKGGSAQIFNDMYSGATIGLTYKFGYKGGCITTMVKDYALVKYETTPPVLSEKGDSVMVTVKGSFPEKYFCPTAVMHWQPVVKYEGGQYELKPITLKGEKITGDGIMIPYKAGGTFTYTQVFPYKPEMNTSELVVAPIAYESKEKVVLKKEEIKEKAKFADLPSRLLAPGIIYTPTRIMLDQTTIIADHGYVKEVIVSKEGVIYFKKNKYDQDLKYGINKTDPAKNALTELQAFLKQGWKLKNIEIDGWASPEGEETLNANLSENRSKTGNQYVIDWYKAQVKEANKNNKDKKAVKALVEAAGKDVNIVLNHHGPDWNGFMKNVQASTVKDKDKIMNVVNSASTQLKKEQEIRNMILIYPEIEENMLPPLRRAIIKANCYEPRFSDAELSQMAVNSPDKLKVEELLYAGTLTSDADTKLTIYDNAARLYGDNWKALNNAACANIAKGNLEKSLNYLNKAAEKAPNNGIIENNLGTVYAKMKDYKKAEDHFKKAQGLGENTNYNMGVLMIPKGDYQKANSLLANATCTYNLGLAQLVSGNTAGAETTLKCAPQTPETHYLLAVIGAKKADTKMLYENLIKACQDPNLKAQAKGDREFLNYANTPDFQSIVK
jgi:tetratricopeptide (TPR) repeat protein